MSNVTRVGNHTTWRLPQRVAPQRETGWSTRHDIERAKIHDFRNLLAELIFAMELNEDRMVRTYTDDLQRMYREAVYGREDG